jgi:DNA-binding LacI/PurR family transcriptional regulator
MGITLKDIAEKADVSVATVSRVMNPATKNLVKSATAKKVLDWADKLNYQNNNNPNPDQYRIAYILSEVTSKFNHPYFLEIIEEIERLLKLKGHKIVFAEIEEDLLKNKRLDYLLQSKLDGVISISDHLDEKLFLKLTQQTPNLVFIGNRFNSYSRDTVLTDRKKAAFQAIKFLVQKGHQKIGFIGGDIFPYSMKKTDRYLGYQQALNKFNLTIKKQFIKKANWQVESGYLKMMEIIKNNNLNSKNIHNEITAFFIASDQLAIGALKALHEKNITVPDDISIISHDDIKMAAYANPPLTTIAVPKQDLALMAVNLLILRIEDKINLPVQTFLPVEIIERGSVKNLSD